jgi:predicted short-subunit dehydrogenase-like oxidoreductase (DUF2520 family)
MIKISLLGYGNLGQHLARKLQELEGIQLVEIYSPSQKTDKSLNVPIINELKNLSDADLYIAAVSDDAIAEISQKLPQDYILVHTSGTVAMDVLGRQSKRGVFYPLQSFSKGHSVAFDQIPICIEANNAETLGLLERLAAKISQKVVHISSRDRLNLHLGAVLVNNFTNHLYTLSKHHLKQKGLSLDLLHPLILETAQKAVVIGPEWSQTGPAKRGDLKTIERHLGLIEDEQLKEMYNLLSDSIRAHTKSK